MSASDGTILSALDSGPKPRMPGAIILGGAHGSLATARSLGRRGIPVWFMTSDHPLAAFSRYTERSFKWPGPGAKGAIEYLVAFIRTHRLQGWPLFAGGDSELRLVSQNYPELSKLVRVTAPPWHIAEFACNKTKTYRQAEIAGVDYPRCYHLHDRFDLLKLDFRFPVVIKPVSHDTANAFTSAKGWKAGTRAELVRRYHEALALAGDGGIVLQEFIPGTGHNQFSYAAVWQGGRPLASLVARRVRQYPPEFGFTSTYVEVIENAEVETAAVKFLQSLNYSGIVELEFKFDARDNRYKLLDFNARAWTWIALGSSSGTDFPYLLWLGQVPDYTGHVRGRAGAVWMHAARDLVTAMQQMMRGTLTPAGYLRSLRLPITFAAFAIDDPLPGFIELPLTLYRVFMRQIAHGPVLRRPFKSAAGFIGQFRRSKPS